jgi:hypothetical protein
VVDRGGVEPGVRRTALMASNTPSTAHGMIPSSVEVPVCVDLSVPVVPQQIAGEGRLTMVNDLPLPV